MVEARTSTTARVLQFTPSQPDQRIGDKSLARRRYQKGSVKFTGGKWRARWREDVVLADGTVKRVNRKKVLGTKKDFATKPLASREMELILAPVNSVHYRPTHQITFAEFARRWSEKVKPIAYKEGGSPGDGRKACQGEVGPRVRQPRTAGYYN
jgi:hypothetical protein